MSLTGAKPERSGVGMGGSGGRVFHRSAAAAQNVKRAAKANAARACIFGLMEWICHKIHPPSTVIPGNGNWPGRLRLSLTCRETPPVCLPLRPGKDRHFLSTQLRGQWKRGRSDRLPREPGWQFEPKWDGFRCLLFRGGQ